MSRFYFIDKLSCLEIGTERMHTHMEWDETEQERERCAWGEKKLNMKGEGGENK